MRRPNPTEEEIRVAVGRARSHYHDHVKHQLTEADKGRYVAIDGKSLEWERNATCRCGWAIARPETSSRAAQVTWQRATVYDAIVDTGFTGQLALL